MATVLPAGRPSELRETRKVFPEEMGLRPAALPGVPGRLAIVSRPVPGNPHGPPEISCVTGDVSPGVSVRRAGPCPGSQ